MDCRCLTQVEGGVIETRKKIFDKHDAEFTKVTQPLISRAEYTIHMSQDC
jgi:hypothetical protein